MNMLRIARVFVVVLTVVGVSACAGPVTPMTSAPSSPDPSVSVDGSLPVQPSDVAKIVVAADSPPDGMEHNVTEETADAVLRQLGAKESGKNALAEALANSGFVAGRYATFSGEGGALLSWAALFDSEANAERAFRSYLNELRSADGYGLEAPFDPSLGDEGTCDEGDVILETGPLHEAICLWRVGALVLAAGGPIDAAQVHAVVAGMNARVPRT